MATNSFLHLSYYSVDHWKRFAPEKVPADRGIVNYSPQNQKYSIAHNVGGKPGKDSFEIASVVFLMFPLLD